MQLLEQRDIFDKCQQQVGEINKEYKENNNSR